MVILKISLRDLPTSSSEKNRLAHRILRTRLSVKQVLDVQFGSVLYDFFQFQN